MVAASEILKMALYTQIIFMIPLEAGIYVIKLHPPYSLATTKLPHKQINHNTKKKQKKKTKTCSYSNSNLIFSQPAHLYIRSNQKGNNHHKIC